MSPTVLDFDPGDVAQVDFGRGSTIEDVFTEQAIATWNFVTMLPVHLCYTQSQPRGNFRALVKRCVKRIRRPVFPIV